MFEGQPKGLYALALANTGERFGYYTMLAIFTLFLQAKFGYTTDETSTIFGGFLGFVYFMPLVGGFLADRVGYGKLVTLGIIVMFIGYTLLAVPVGADWSGKVAMYGALLLIAIGTGLFKGNLQVMVGNLYNTPKLTGKRDTAFSLFYMAINVGALFAPTAATKVTKYAMGKSGLSYVAELPALAHQYLGHTEKAITAESLQQLQTLAAQQGNTGDLAAFCTRYLNELSGAYHWGFAVACISLVLSMAIYVLSRSTYKHADISTKKAETKTEAQNIVELSPSETKDRIVALLLVFAVVIFFWMAFHQNGLTMTFFARDYTVTSVTGLDRLGFDVWNLIAIIVVVYGAFSLFQSKTITAKAIASGVITAAIAFIVLNYNNMDTEIAILPQIFQQFNPFFVVALTPVSLAIFSYLNKKGAEPSAPRKIGMGMLIAAIGFAVLALGSWGLPTPDALTEGTKPELVSQNWLIGTYLILTFAELLLSPMGMSFVTKVAPPKYQGMMMGGWFVATAIGNYLVSIIGYLWGGLDLWILWTILIACCLVSALFIFSILKRLEKVAK